MLLGLGPNQGNLSVIVLPLLCSPLFRTSVDMLPVLPSSGTPLLVPRFLFLDKKLLTLQQLIPFQCALTLNLSLLIEQLPLTGSHDQPLLSLLVELSREL